MDKKPSIVLLLARAGTIRMLMIVLYVFELVHGPLGLHQLEGGSLDRCVEQAEQWLLSLYPLYSHD